jgi:alpha-galactosidase
VEATTYIMNIIYDIKKEKLLGHISSGDFITRLSDWMKLMQKKYDYDLFRQDLKGFGEPTEGDWDGWSRINTDTKEGGIVGIFKQGSLDNECVVSVASLHKDKMYRISEAPESREITTMSGYDLQEKGFKVKMDDKYDSRIFEIELQKK